MRAAEQVAPGRMVVEIAPGGVIRIMPLDARQTDAQRSAQDVLLGMALKRRFRPRSGTSARNDEREETANMSPR